MIMVCIAWTVSCDGTCGVLCLSHGYGCVAVQSAADQVKVGMPPPVQVQVQETRAPSSWKAEQKTSEPPPDQQHQQQHRLSGQQTYEQQ